MAYCWNSFTIFQFLLVLSSDVKLTFGSPHYKVMVRLSFANIQLYNKNYLYLVKRQTDYFLNDIFERLPCYLKKTFVWVDFEAFIVCRTKMPMPYNLKSIAGRRTYLEGK